MIELVDYIRNNGLYSLEKDFFISVKQSKTYNNLYLLKYSQIDSPMKEIIVQQARGIILDADNGWKLVNYTFSKFFNYGEIYADSIDSKTAKIYDKLDGSLLQLYYYKGWRVASSGNPDADGPVGYFNDLTFADLFWKIWEKEKYKLPDNPNECFAFELTSPFNAVVVQYPESNLTLIGARDLTTLQEIDPLSVAEKYGWRSVKSYPFTSLEDTLKAAKKLDFTKNEGFVICDGNFNRVKIKNSDYVKAHLLKSSMSRKNLLDLIRSNETSEFFTYMVTMPSWEKDFVYMKDAYDKLVVETEDLYNQWMDIPIQKDFALLATKTKISAALFALRNKKAKSAKDFYSNMQIDKLMDLLSIEDLNIE